MTKLLCILTLVALTGCAPEVVETKPENAQAVVDSLVYVQAKNGLCFGVTSTHRVSSSLTVAENQLLVSVPCLPN